MDSQVKTLDQTSEQEGSGVQDRMHTLTLESPTPVNNDTMKTFERHEREKKRHYNHRIMNIEHGTFTPLVFSVTGVMGKEYSMFHKHMADTISKKTEENYSDIMNVLKCKLSFLILRASLLCIRGSRTHKKDSKITDDFTSVFFSVNYTNFICTLY